MRKFLCFLFLLAVPLSRVKALYNPLSLPNNRYGIHVADMSDIEEASKLVNSSGGDWGYVTLVISEADRNAGRMQEVFNDMRRYHLIPIVRIATHFENGAWTVPQKIDADKWSSFLGSLNWPVENRYVVLFNEPNHAKEWGNSIDPEGYADVAVAYTQALKKSSEDFFILPAGFDASAPSGGQTLDEQDFLRRMDAQNPGIFNTFDGWTSHSYPNPGFSSSPYGRGKGSIGSFLWEMDYLKSLSLTKKLPVFITETGWIHSQGKNISPALSSPEAVGMQYREASETIWKDPSVAAITPFVFNYQDMPFDHFSFRKIGSREYYSHYASYASIVKQDGTPKQRERFTFREPPIPDTLITNSTYTFTQDLKNSGQCILSKDDGYELTISGQTSSFSFFAESLPIIEPGEEKPVQFHLKTPREEGQYALTLRLTHNGSPIDLSVQTVTVIPPPNIAIRTVFGWKKAVNQKNATVLIYSQNNELLHKFTNLTVTDNALTITGLYNMVPGSTYRLVMLVPRYLPRQAHIVLGEGTTNATLRRFLPLDFNGDGMLSIEDLPALLFTTPYAVFERFF